MSMDLHVPTETFASRARKERLLRLSMNAKKDDGIDLRRGRSDGTLGKGSSLRFKPKPLIIVRVAEKPAEPFVPKPLPEPKVKLPRPRLTVARILAEVSCYFMVSVIDIKSHRRTANVMRPRQCAYYLARKLTLLSMPDIGRRIGDRDHTSVISGVKRVDKLIANGDTALADALRHLTNVLAPSEEANPFHACPVNTHTNAETY